MPGQRSRSKSLARRILQTHEATRTRSRLQDSTVASRARSKTPTGPCKRHLVVQGQIPLPQKSPQRKKQRANSPSPRRLETRDEETNTRETDEDLLAQAYEELKRVNAENETLRRQNTALKERLNFYEDEAEKPDASARVGPLKQRVKELESEVLALKSHIDLGEASTSEDCANCSLLKKKKDWQGDFLRTQLSRSRKEATVEAHKYTKVKSALDECESAMKEMNDRYQKNMANLSTEIRVYRGRSERLESWNRALLGAFDADMRNVRQRVREFARSVLNTLPS